MMRNFADAISEGDLYLFADADREPEEDAVEDPDIQHDEDPDDEDPDDNRE